MEEEKKNDKPKMRHGGRNLVLMGVSAVVIALLTTGVSLAVYHDSGDIYLDRSRPGFLPDEAEAEAEAESEDEKEYELNKSGLITAEVLEEYLDELKVETDAIDAYEKPFDAKVLTDEELGIPKKSE